MPIKKTVGIHNLLQYKEIQLKVLLVKQRLGDQMHLLPQSQQ
jgi:hypothetical protein